MRQRTPSSPVYWRIGIATFLVLACAGCSLDGLLKTDQVPEGVNDPKEILNPSGAMGMYAGTLVRFRDAVGAAGKFIERSGLLSDELTKPSVGAGGADPADIRILPVPNTDGLFQDLHGVRGQANQAITLLTRYVPERPALAGHAYALAGYAEVLLAELYCSGIPLSTLQFDGGYTLAPGSTTAEVFTHAVALFDTALALAGDSVSFAHLAEVGKARALLGLGDYAAAAAVAAAIPDAYAYTLAYSAEFDAPNFAELASGSTTWDNNMGDREGGNGLDFASSGDPRTPVTVQSGTVYYPSKYTVNGESPIVVASGVEARLIQAEAALQANPDDGIWLATLNALRTNGTFDVDTQVVSVDNSVVPPDTTFAYDTLWHAGSGGSNGLAPLADPGTPDSRVDLLFRERAFWLFLTGHRQGDLRRLIRQYHRPQDVVYPIGAYLTTYEYGGDVTFPAPLVEEQLVNAQYTGCFTRDA